MSCTHNVSVLLYIFFIKLIFPPFFIAAETEPLSQKHVAILERLSAKIQNNEEKIITWQGEVDHYFCNNNIGGKGNLILKSNITFCMDKKANNYFSLVIPNTHWDESINNNKTPLPLDIIGRILYDDRDYLFLDHPPNSPGLPISDLTDSPSKGMLTISIRKITSFNNNDSKRFFSPEKMLNEANSMRQNLDYLAGTIKIGKEDILKGATINQRENLVIYRSEKPFGSPNPNVNVFTFDLSKGGMPISREYISPDKTYSSFSGELVQTNDIWHYSTLEWKLNGQLMEKNTLIKSIINDTIDREQFSPKSLGVKQGCLVTDTIKEISYVITDSSYPVPTTNKFLCRVSYIRFIFIILGSFLIILPIALKFYKHRSKK